MIPPYIYPNTWIIGACHTDFKTGEKWIEMNPRLTGWVREQVLRHEIGHMKRKGVGLLWDFREQFNPKIFIALLIALSLNPWCWLTMFSPIYPITRNRSYSIVPINIIFCAVVVMGWLL